MTTASRTGRKSNSIWHLAYGNNRPYTCSINVVEFWVDNSKDFFDVFKNVIGFMSKIVNLIETQLYLAIHEIAQVFSAIEFGKSGKGQARLEVLAKILS